MDKDKDKKHLVLGNKIATTGQFSFYNVSQLDEQDLKLEPTPETPSTQSSSQTKVVESQSPQGYSIVQSQSTTSSGYTIGGRS